MPQKIIKVVAAVIRKGDLVFATERGYGSYKGWWEFPGGKTEPNETPDEALIREIKEELDTLVQVDEYITTVEYDYPEFHLSMDCFWCSIVSGSLTLKEARDARWLNSQTIDSVKWLPADRGLVGTIKEKLKEQSNKGLKWTD